MEFPILLVGAAVPRKEAGDNVAQMEEKGRVGASETISASILK